LHVTEDEDFALDKYFLTREQERLMRKRDLPIPNAEADGVDLETAQPVLFIVLPPVWASDLRLDPEQEDEVIFTIRERFYRYLLREYPHPVRVRYSYIPTDPLMEGYRVINVQT